MSKKLTKEMNCAEFRQYYYLKEELVQFCRDNDLPVSGGKLEISDRIAHYLDTGEVLKADPIRNSAPTVIGNITLQSLIEPNFVCTEVHRAFFKNIIGKGFSFNVVFQKWLKTNTGKTYEQAVEAYYEIMQNKKTSKTTIDRQFEYNTYIRDFFSDNQGRSLDDAIKCWKYKKEQPGYNKYERIDLKCL